MRAAGSRSRGDGGAAPSAERGGGVPGVEDLAVVGDGGQADAPGAGGRGGVRSRRATVVVRRPPTARDRRATTAGRPRRRGCSLDRRDRPAGGDRRPGGRPVGEPRRGGAGRPRRGASSRRRPQLPVDRVGDNVVARTELGPRPRGSSLAGHLDTVPANGNGTPRIDGDVLWGLGVGRHEGRAGGDARAGATAIADPAVDVTWVFYAGEEVAAVHNGLRHLFARATRPRGGRRGAAGRAHRRRARGRVPGIDAASR